MREEHCIGCIESFSASGNLGTCPFCKAEFSIATDEEKSSGHDEARVKVNDARAMFELGTYYYNQGEGGLQQDDKKAIELLTMAAEFGSSQAHYHLGLIYYAGGDSKKGKLHYEAAAIAGNELARFHLGKNDYISGNMERAIKHWTIAASAGSHYAMHNLILEFESGYVSRDTINSLLTAYNNYCVEMRSEARDASID